MATRNNPMGKDSSNGLTADRKPTFSDESNLTGEQTSTAPVEPEHIHPDPLADDGVNDETDDTTDDTDYVYVTMPNGQVRAISRTDVEESQRKNAATLAAGVNIPAAPADDVDVYVHLANGEVRRVKTSELPPTAGTNAVNGYFEEDGKVHHVIGVYPVEDEMEK